MDRRSFVAVSMIVALLVGGAAGAAIDHYGINQNRSALPPSKQAAKPSGRVTKSSRAPTTTSTTTTTTPTTPVTLEGDTQVLPIADSGPLSVPASAQPPTIIEPSTCTVSGNVATATGTIDQADVDESLIRAGDVIELYVFSGADPDDPIQLGTLTLETPSQLVPNWVVKVPLAPNFAVQVGVHSYCDVALQSTHAFMLAGSAGS
jgi:hypothetical protein